MERVALSAVRGLLSSVTLVIVELLVVVPALKDLKRFFGFLGSFLLAFPKQPKSNKGNTYLTFDSTNNFVNYLSWYFFRVDSTSLSQTTTN